MAEDVTKAVGNGSSSLDLRDVVKALVRDVPDYPEPGVIFKDVTPVLANGEVFSAVVDWMSAPLSGAVDVVVAIEARGFILGAAVAYALGVGLVPVRKLGKLPWTTDAQAYELEYGEATLEVHTDALAHGQRVVVIDDVIATGGTLMAAVELIGRARAHVVEVVALLGIVALGGMKKLTGTPAPTRVLVSS